MTGATSLGTRTGIVSRTVLTDLVGGGRDGSDCGRNLHFARQLGWPYSGWPGDASRRPWHTSERRRRLAQ